MSSKAKDNKITPDDDNDTIDKMWISKFTLCLYPIQYFLFILILFLYH